MRSESLRWALPDQDNALEWCKKRNRQGICCTLDMLGEDVKSVKAAGLAADAIISCAEAIDKRGLDAGLAVKLTSLGALFDKKLARNNILQIFHETEHLNVNVNIEVDMEGIPLVEYTLGTALELAERGYYVTLALQAYLDKTPEDIKKVIEKNITVRLVKGAYMGDTTDFLEIQNMFKNCFGLLIDSGRYFSISTHDPELIEWVMEQAGEQRDIFEFGFLKGLADETKLELVQDGWQVSEYVPFGRNSRAYVMRRERYLKTLEDAGRVPAK